MLEEACTINVHIPSSFLIHFNIRGSYINDLCVGLTSYPIIWRERAFSRPWFHGSCWLTSCRAKASCRPVLILVPQCHGGQIFNLDFFNENRNIPIMACLKGTQGAKRSQQTIPLPASSHLVCFIAQGEPWRTIRTLLWSARGENRNFIVTCLYFKICKGFSLPISKLTFWGWNTDLPWSHTMALLTLWPLPIGLNPLDLLSGS